MTRHHFRTTSVFMTSMLCAQYLEFVISDKQSLRNLKRKKIIEIV